MIENETPSAHPHVRGGGATVRPYLHATEDLVAFLKRVFGATEEDRHPYPAGGAHVELRIGDGIVIVEAFAEPPPREGGAVYVYVPDVDAAYERAIAAGAKAVAAPEDKPYGERNAGFTTASGHTWWIGTMSA